MINIYEINELNNIQTFNFQGSKIYVMDDFYRYPEEVLSRFLSIESKIWKEKEIPSYNKVHFLDKRHDFHDDNFINVGEQLSKICGEPVAQPGRIVTNIMKFIDRDFNDYKNNYWWPHCDLGHTALIYLNNFEYPGTNIYEPLEQDNWNTVEHYEPWRPKEKYKVILTLNAKFNRMVLFDAKKLFHGMNVSDDTFFHRVRMNQAIFFKPAV